MRVTKYFDIKRSTWYLNWRDVGQRYRVSLGKVTEKEAEKERLAQELALYGVATQTPSKSPTLSEFLDRYLEWHSAEYPDSHFRVLQICQDYLAPVFGPEPMGLIQASDVEAYKQHRMRDAAASTVAKELRTLNAVLNRAVIWDVIPKNPIYKKVSAPKDVESKAVTFFSAEELERIYAADDQYAPVWKLMANTGLRRAEALALTWAHVDAGRIRVESTGFSRTKSGKWRPIILNEAAQAALRVLRAQDHGEWVIPHILPRSLSRAFERTCARAGLANDDLHALRHTFCSHLVMRGVPLRTIQKLAGHSRISVTEQYAHLAPGYLEDAVNQIDL